MPVVFSPGSWLDSDTLERERERMLRLLLGEADFILFGNLEFEFVVSLSPKLATK